MIHIYYLLHKYILQNPHHSGDEKHDRHDDCYASHLDSQGNDGEHYKNFQATSLSY